MQDLRAYLYFFTWSYSRSVVSITRPLSINRVSTALSRFMKIAIHMKIRIQAITFLNRHVGEDARFILVMNILPKWAISHNIRANHAIYAIILVNPHKKLAGKTVAIRIAYVGEQVLNTGHNVAHKRTSHRNQLFWVALAFWVSHSIFVRCMSFCRRLGTSKSTPKTIKIPADIFVRNIWDIPNLVTSRCKISVNIRIDIENDAMITRGLDFFPFTTDHHTITGRIGKTHGASTVSTHAKNDISKSPIVLSSKKLNFYFWYRKINLSKNMTEIVSNRQGI